MFKQQNQPLKQTEGRNRLLRQKQSILTRNRGGHLGIKLVTNSTEQNKPNINNQSYLPIVKPNETGGRNSSIKGIQVMSSRQSSNQRRQLATSRSHERQKQSREIKSQTNISQFEEKQRSKQASISKQDQSLSEMQDLCLLYEGKFKQAMLKNNAVYQLELDSLKEIIGSNQERINNLITTLNYMAQKEEKRVKIAQKLQQRLQSIAKYHQQCYQYTLRRMQSLQSVYSTIVAQIQDQSSQTKLQCGNRFKNIELIIKDIFMIQRISSKHQLSLACQEISKFHVAINEIDLKINVLSSIKNNIRNVEVKHDALKQHLAQINLTVNQCKKRLNHRFESSQPQFSLTQIQLRFNNQLLILQNRIQQLEKCRYDLQILYQNRQDKAEKTIRELSSLMNRNQLELQKKKKESEELSKYNLQIQNKLIQSRLKENSLKFEVDSYYKILESSKRQQHDLISKQKQVYKQKFEELFKQNQYLQSVNCNNKYLLMQKQRQIASLKQKFIEKQGQIDKLLSLNGLAGEKQQQLNRLTFENAKLRYQLDCFKNQNQQIKDMLNENAKQISILQGQNRKMEEQNIAVKKDKQEIIAKFSQVSKQFKQQQLYSEHLQHQNEELQNNLNQYKRVFENQSLIFKQTITNLQKENLEMRKILEMQSEKLFAGQSIKFQANNSQTGIYLPESKINTSKLQSFNNLNKLKHIFQKMKVKMPVMCEIDSSGYLKSYETGTYIIDEQENLFELSDLQIQAGVQEKIFKLFQ